MLVGEAVAVGVVVGVRGEGTKISVMRRAKPVEPDPPANKTFPSPAALAVNCERSYTIDEPEVKIPFVGS